MRPRGEIRQALSDAARALHAEARQATWRDLAQRAQVGLADGRRTVENMVRAGELLPAAPVRVPHSCRPMMTYVPKPERACCAGPALDVVLRAWGR